MLYILFAFFLFIASMIAHVLFCRQHNKSELHAKAYLLISFLFGVVYAAMAFIISHSRMIDPHSWWGEPFILTAGMIYILLVPVYLCFYVLTQLMSPSKKILTTVAQKGEASYAEILASLQEENFIKTRLHDLGVSGCVNCISGRYLITPEGKKVAVILNFMQLVLGRKMGG